MRVFRTRLGLALIAVLALGAAITTVVASATILREDTPPRAATIDPTPIPTATPADNPPPAPGSLPRSPAPSSDRATPLVLPGVASLKLGSDQRYTAVADDGCKWAESFRGQSVTLKREIVILRTDCRDDVILQYDAQSRTLTAASVLLQPASPTTVPPSTPEKYEPQPEPPDGKALPTAETANPAPNQPSTTQ